MAKAYGELNIGENYMSDEPIVETKSVTINLLPETLSKIAKLTALTGQPSRTQGIVQALEIADIVVTAIRNGEEVLISKSDGTKRKIVLPPLT